MRILIWTFLCFLCLNPFVANAAQQRPFVAEKNISVIVPPDETNPQKHDLNSILAIVVCAMLPYMGLHRVMMGGKWWLIPLYIFTLGGFGGILGFMDMIKMIVEPEQYRNNNHFLAALGFMSK